MKKTNKLKMSVRDVKNADVHRMDYSNHHSIQTGVSHHQIYEACQLPPNENKIQWLHTNCVNFVNITTQVNLLVEDYCTNIFCPNMVVGTKEYIWKEDGSDKSIPAKVYIQKALDWIVTTLNDKSLFPLQMDEPEPNKEQMTMMMKMFQRLFRVFSHILNAHFNQIKNPMMQGHCMTIYRHLYVFTRVQELLTKEDYLPMINLLKKIDKDFDLPSI